MISHGSIDSVSRCLLIHISDHVVLPWRLNSDLLPSICIHASAHLFDSYQGTSYAFTDTNNQFESFINNFTQAGEVGRNRVDFTFLILTAFKIQRSNVIIVLKFYQATVSCAKYLETKATVFPV